MKHLHLNPSSSSFLNSFKKSEVESLIRIFYSLVERADVRLDNIGLDCNAFQMILHNIFGMTDDVLMNRVFFAFDKDNDNLINAKEWVKGLSVFLRGTFEEKLKFCFEVYYFNGDGYISREKIFDMLKNSLHQQSPEEETDEGITELVDITLKKMDYDNDGKLSFEDFEKAVKEDRLLLEVFGPCLPEAKVQRQQPNRVRENFQRLKKKNKNNLLDI
uniref:EF-hand domain-containing protein n=1 Tax=Sus scrofa TaxID=9823 RepID=A0A8D1JMF8_PIG